MNNVITKNLARKKNQELFLNTYIELPEFHNGMENTDNLAKEKFSLYSPEQP